MRTIKVADWEEIPENYTGIVEWSDGDKEWFKNGKLHREDGPARITSHEDFFLNGNKIYCSFDSVEDFVVLSETQHPYYSSVKIYKLLTKENIRELLVIPGMENHIKLC